VKVAVLRVLRCELCGRLFVALQYTLCMPCSCDLCVQTVYSRRSYALSTSVKCEYIHDKLEIEKACHLVCLDTISVCTVVRCMTDSRYKLDGSHVVEVHSNRSNEPLILL
jgi:hypothetical protein